MSTSARKSKAPAPARKPKPPRSYVPTTALAKAPAQRLPEGACEPECPVEAIFHEANVPGPWAAFVARNAERVVALKESGGHITEKQEPKGGPGCAGRR